MKNFALYALTFALALCACADEAQEKKSYEVELKDAPGLEAQKAEAVMNCHTGVCTCTGMSSSTCTTACDILWDENCSKPQ